MCCCRVLCLLSDNLVVKCRPELDAASLTAVVDRLNETREFSLFLKDMRQLFKMTALGDGR